MASRAATATGTALSSLARLSRRAGDGFWHVSPPLRTLRVEAGGCSAAPSFFRTRAAERRDQVQRLGPEASQLVGRGAVVVSGRGQPRWIASCGAARSMQQAARVSAKGSTGAAAAPPEVWGNLDRGLLEGLNAIDMVSPTEIQRLALDSHSKTTGSGEVLLLAETGSGKTLSYLVPAVQRIKEAEVRMGCRARPRRPRAIIIVPTRELGEQVLLVAKSLSHKARFSVSGVFGGARMSLQGASLTRGCDMVVATPMRLVELADEGLLRWGDVRALVVDEADTIFDQGFGTELTKVRAPPSALRDGSNSALEERRFPLPGPPKLVSAT